MSTHILDHIIHLTPPGSVEQISAMYRRLGFDVIPGGTHSDGLTYNALVTFSDGVYLELIAFVLPSPPPSHRWASATPGWIDFANLALTPDVSHVLNERAAHESSGVAYHTGLLGGRQTPEDKTLQWRVTFPETTHEIGRLPFFCEDLTPRQRRVPKPGNHSSAARGISYIKLLAVDTKEFATLSAQLTTVLGMLPSVTTPAAATWPLDTPIALPDLSTQLILELGKDDTNTRSSKSGICEVGFWVDKGQGGHVDTQYGKIAWTPIPKSHGVVYIK